MLLEPSHEGLCRYGVGGQRDSAEPWSQRSCHTHCRRAFTAWPLPLWAGHLGLEPKWPQRVPQLQGG